MAHFEVFQFIRSVRQFDFEKISRAAWFFCNFFHNILEEEKIAFRFNFLVLLMQIYPILERRSTVLLLLILLLLCMSRSVYPLAILNWMDWRDLVNKYFFFNLQNQKKCCTYNYFTNYYNFFNLKKKYFFLWQNFFSHKF